jgi:copper chaperone CopZ
MLSHVAVVPSHEDSHDSPATQTFELIVQGDLTIHCAGCEARAENVVSRIPGVRDAKASHRDQTLRVALDPAEASVEAVQEKLAQIGYATVLDSDGDRDEAQ